MNAPFDPAALPGSAPAGFVEIPAEPTLSICVPTYNRAHFLRHLFPHIREASRDFDFSYEIVVSDNASPDETPEVVEQFRAEGMPIRYFRQEENKRLSNLFSAFRRARGHYLVYLADDDLIIPKALADNIRFMLANPELRAVYTPFEIYDALNDRVQCRFYDLDSDLAIFRPGQEVDLLTMIVKNNIIPEIVIYRADAVRSLVTAPQFCYWAFTYLATMIAEGPIAFRRVPYYRSVTLTPIVADRSQEGTHDNLYNWDAFRGGLELMIYSLLKRHGIKPDDAARRGFRNMVDRFLSLRMHVTLRLWLGRQDYVRAYEIICRLNYLNPDAVENIDNLDMLPPMFLAQTLARLANGIAGIERVVVAGVEEVAAVGALMRDLGLEERIAVVSVDDAEEGGEEASLVFIGQEALREDCLARGYQPGLIVSERDIGINIVL